MWKSFCMEETIEPEDKKAQTPPSQMKLCSCSYTEVEVVDSGPFWAQFPFQGCRWGGGDEMREKSNSWVFSLTEVTDAVSHSMIQGMGCATETACNLKNMTVMENVQINTHCFSGSPPLRPISSVLTSLFLMEALLCPLGTVTSMILLHI